MDLRQFEHDLDRYGADLSLWPAKDGAAAADLLALTPAARALFDAMRRVEGLLRGDAACVWAPQSTVRFAAEAVRRRQNARSAVVRTAWAAAAAAAMSFGLVLGDLMPERHVDPAGLVNAAFAVSDSVDVD